jgi:tRNA 2-thiouridine synthesizing protein A
MSATKRIDVRGMTCSDAVVRLHKAIAPLDEGSLVHIVADDEDVLADLERYAKRGGHAWGGARPSGGALEAEVRRGA